MQISEPAAGQRSDHFASCKHPQGHLPWGKLRFGSEEQAILRVRAGDLEFDMRQFARAQRALVRRGRKAVRGK
jgi:hypothetical protein